MENKISKYQKFCILIYIIMGLNYILLVLLGSGIFEKANANFFEKCFIISSIVLPNVLVGVLMSIKSRFQDVKVYQKKDISIYLPLIQSTLIILLFGVKFIIQLDRLIFNELLISIIAFVLVNLILAMILTEKEVSIKRFNVISIITCVLMLAFILMTTVFAYDYSVLL